MARLPVVRTRDVVAAFERAGGVFIKQTGSHLKYRMPDGKIVILVNYSGRDYPAGTLRSCIAQAGMTEADFLTYLKG